MILNFNLLSVSLNTFNDAIIIGVAGGWLTVLIHFGAEESPPTQTF